MYGGFDCEGPVDEIRNCSMNECPGLFRETSCYLDLIVFSTLYCLYYTKIRHKHFY